MRQNRCLYHEKSELLASGKCHMMVYIKPIKESDNRRWFGFLSNTESSATHLHPMPVESKIGSQLHQDLEKTVNQDPSKTPSQISLGLGVRYMPVTKSAAAANKGTLRHVIKKLKVDVIEAKAIDLVKNFDRLVKNSIDEKDSAASTVDGMNEQVLDRCTPYLRYTCNIEMKISDLILIFSKLGDFDFGNAFSTVVFATPQMLDVFAVSIFL